MQRSQPFLHDTVLLEGLVDDSYRTFILHPMLYNNTHCLFKPSTQIFNQLSEGNLGLVLMGESGVFGA